MPQLKVIVVDDHHLVRSGLREAVSAQADIQIVAECSTGAQAIETLGAQECDVLLLDLSLPDMSGLDVLKFVTDRQADKPAVIVLSGFPEKQFGMNVLRGGAKGFVSKSAGEGELVRAIRTVAQGKRYLSPELSILLANRAASGGKSDDVPHAQLSNRELQIFMKLAQGVSVSEMAAELSLSVKTVSTYRTRILEKLDMRTNADIVRYAIANELT